MKNENEFNAWLSKELRKLQPDVFHLKVSDKFHTGVPDFFIWANLQRTAALETKYVQSLPTGNGLVLDHTFTPAQINFLRSVRSTGNPAWGMVAIGNLKEMVLFPIEDIPECGNWQGYSFSRIYVQKFNEVRGMVSRITGAEL